MSVEHFTPPVEELLPSYRIKCRYDDCNSNFTNAGNYDLHLRSHHKIQPNRKDTLQRLFYCPDAQCIYNVKRPAARHFKNMKYLRQHYQKVHAEKSEICGDCGKKFASAGQLESHKTKVCSVKFTCKECEWDYDSMEALKTHQKRKGHTGWELVPLAKRKAGEEKPQQHRETQTEATAPKLVCLSTPKNETTTQTIESNSKTCSTSTSPMRSQSLPCDSETQTELTASALNGAFRSSADPVLTAPPSTHTWTQTYGDLFSDSLLGFTDIQTQTNWSMLSGENQQSNESAYGTSVSACARCAYDELLVSTETQTSFTQCLLDSRNDGEHEVEESGFGGLHNTQHTQTCDTLLEGLFGSQENDLIGGFQSTYTQT